MPKSSTKEYKTWHAMKARCNNLNNDNYEWYGGRGIKICPEWENDFDKFLKDMGPRPENTTLDRIDNNLGYSKENCRWADNFTQSNNKRGNRILEYNGRKQTLCQWAKEFGIPYDFLYDRIFHGWSLKDALTIKKGATWPRLTFNGETLRVPEWAKRVGIKSCTIRQRINLFGWSIEDALTIPTGTKSRRWENKLS